MLFHLVGTEKFRSQWWRVAEELFYFRSIALQACPQAGTCVANAADQLHFEFLF